MPNKIKIEFEDPRYRRTFRDSFKHLYRKSLFGKNMSVIKLEIIDNELYIVFEDEYDDIRNELDLLWGEITLDGCALPMNKPDTLVVPIIECNLINATMVSNK